MSLVLIGDTYLVKKGLRTYTEVESLLSLSMVSPASAFSSVSNSVEIVYEF